MALCDQLGHYTKTDYPICEGDIYVSVKGSDENDGTREHPFATLERAVSAVRTLKAHKKGVTVCVHAGEYPTSGLTLTGEDSGSADCPITYRAYGDGEVILNGGITIPGGDFEPIRDEERARLHGEACEHVVRVDLKRYGLTAADWGRLCPIGAFGTEDKYDDCEAGANCELFLNGQRMTLARYPDEGFLKLGAVADVGDVWEFPEQNYYYDWKERRNHRGGTYIMDKPTTARASGWRDTGDIWAYGYFYHDWADSSTPIKGFDIAHRTFYPAYVSRFGARKDALYYFYNVFEELDAPGEWYLDRENGWLYFYPPVDLKDARVEMTVTRRSIIDAQDVHYVTLEGFTIKGTRADAVTLRGDHNVLRKLNVYGVMGNAAVIEGQHNLVTECEVSHTGKGGVIVDGGDRETLTPGCNKVDNCLFHDWGEVYMVYCAAVRLDGVGNVCSHNEMYNAPHTAIFYYGNDHVVEYNHIHDVVLHSSDAGAIYSGQDWSRQGCVVRYNCLYDIGGGEFTPDGIYFDDMLSGQTAYGNLLIGVRKNGFLIGGGRDNFVFNNIMVDCGKALTYDDRGRDGFLNNGWAIASVSSYEKGGMWKTLRQAPYQSDIWKKRYPSLGRLSHDFADPDNPDFAVNPAHGLVYNNLVIDAQGSVGRIEPSVERYSTVSHNFAYKTPDEAGFEAGSYILGKDAQAFKDMPGFVNLPLEQIGRY